ncbi:hypothetical protein IGB42_01138 [Andreprevotia sp. IGB-42]|uniref:Hpt domain-containing protein n=1 Tax=Andreprevotia sp. IGB-42 TaxID=2497473 RepID=UPI00135C7264|nr:Hpt domain-containing protein [Andreprevotia sp. IGB-42]KAF0814239.1 hypothetical protein IGB42_01138 [Andreprevotia sp. IGB-42]
MLNHQDEIASIEATFVALEQTLGMDLRGELLHAYFATQEECLIALDAALHNGEAQLAIEAAHKLKGAAAQLGALQLSASCNLLEQEARAGRLAGFAPHWQRMHALATQLGIALKP